MHVKRFYNSTVREALAAARAEFGPDALVLSTELVSAPGWRGWMGRRVVALTAATEREVSARRTVTPFRRHEDADDQDDAMGWTSSSRGALATGRFGGSRRDEDFRDASDDDVRREFARPDKHEAARKGVVARLTACGIETPIAEAAAAQLSPAECRNLTEAVLARALENAVSSLATPDKSQARVEVFVGPPGVGKTTTIAKIAAQSRAAQGPALGMIAADGFRAGAVEHLRSYAAIIGAPFRIARTADELDRTIDASRHAVLVDTAGRSPRDGGFNDLLAVLDRKKQVRTHLVMAADTSPAAARKVIDRYAPAHPTRVVITKLDEAESVAPLLSVIRERQLRVSYLACGQRVPEDLARATPAWLASALINPAGELVHSGEAL
ncbi:MAG: AAA family ATPase [Acidobacteriota bacterium]